MRHCFLLTLVLSLLGCSAQHPAGQDTDAGTLESDSGSPDSGASEAERLMAACDPADAIDYIFGTSSSAPIPDGEYRFVSAASDDTLTVLRLSDGTDEFELSTRLEANEALFEADAVMHFVSGRLGHTLRDADGRLILHSGYASSPQSAVLGATLSSDVAVEFELLCDNIAPHRVSPQFCGNVILAQYQLVVNGVAVPTGDAEVEAADPDTGETLRFRTRVSRIAAQLGYAHDHPCADPTPTPDIMFTVVAQR